MEDKGRQKSGIGENIGSSSGTGPDSKERGEILSAGAASGGADASSRRAMSSRGGQNRDDQATIVLKPAGEPGKEEPPPVQPTLQVVSGSASKTTVALGEEKLTIGRVGFNDLILNDKKVSRSHAAIYFEKGHYVIEDLNSTNGVYIDGSHVKKAILKTGNRISLGDTVLLFTQEVPEIPFENQINFINNSDLFNWLDDETKSMLAKSLAPRFFPKNTKVLNQNTPTESMFFLYSGTARVVDLNEEGGERVVDQVNVGDSFGESALLAGEAGQYSVISSSDIQVLELKKDQLNELLQKKPELLKAFYRMVLKKFSAAQAKPEQADARTEALRHLIVSTDVAIVGEDKKIKEARKKVEALAKEGKPVLITGPSGSGKKYFARYFHKVGSHPEYPYIEMSVAELEPGRIGPAIFGVEGDPEATHMKGQVGYLEMLGTGTLAITHIEHLDVHQQSKLATFLKYGWFHRVYGRESVKSKANVILVGTGGEAEVLDKLTPELRELVQDHIVYIPPLIQRLKDIPLLAEYYLNYFAKKDGKHISGLSREATEKLVSYTWPGNVKELENVIQRAAIVASEDIIIPGDLIFVLPTEKEIHKLNVLRQEGIRDFFRHPLVPKLFMWFNIMMVVIMAGFTLFGGTRPADHPLQDFGNNPGMLITWLVWFPILPISAFLLGRIWCGMCPICGIGNLASKVKSFNLPVPKFLKRMDFWMVVLAFVFLDYIEEFFGVAEKPLATGLLLVIIIGLSVIFCILYERKTFCRYVCPLAGMLGAYSTLSIVEIRGNKKICQTQCGQHLCLKGTEQADGCPMFSYPASLTTNSECMMCFSCVKNCENRGVQLNLRPPLQELWRQAQPLLSLSLLGVILVGLMGRHEFTGLTYWKIIEPTLALSGPTVHTILYLSCIGLAVIPFFLSSLLSAAASQEKVSENMAHYGMAFIPLALSGHVAHVSREFLSAGLYELLAYFVKVYHWVVAGTPIGSQEVVIAPFIHPAVVTFIKFLFISGGLLGSLIAIVMIARRASTKNVLGRIMPHVLLLFFFWAGYLFIFTGSTGDPAPAAATAQAAGTESQAAAPSAPIQMPAPATQPALAPASITFTLTAPNIRDIVSARLDSPNVVQWIRSAKAMPATKQYRLTVQGQVAGSPPGALVRATLDTGTVRQQFTAPSDAQGRFSGDIIVDNLNLRILLMLQLIDAKTQNVLFVHKVTLY